MILDRKNGGVAMDNIANGGLFSYIDSKMFQNCRSVFVVDFLFLPVSSHIRKKCHIKITIIKNVGYVKNTSCIALCTVKVLFENKKPSRRVSVQNLFFSK